MAKLSFSARRSTAEQQPERTANQQDAWQDS